MNKPIAAYIRVSSKSQKHAGQKDVILKWLEGNGINLDQVEWYSDVETGKRMDRKDFDRLQADIFSGKVRTVVVYKVDRIARRLREGLNTLCDWVEKGVRFVSVTQQVDASGVIGRMMLSLMFGLAEIENEYRAERQAAGIVVAKREGVYAGRKEGTTKGKPDRAKELQAKGLSSSEIAEAMGTSVRTVFRYLQA